MAARENQGLHIALILFVMLTVLLAVLCYFTFTSSNEASDRLASMETEKAKQEKVADAYRIQAEILKMYIGFGSMTPEEAEGQIDQLSRLDDTVYQDVVSIQERYDQDMRLFDAAYPGPKNYTSLPSHLESTITTKNNVITVGLQEEKDLLAKKDADVAAANEARLAAEEKAQDYLNDKEQLDATLRTTSDQIQRQQQDSAQLVTTARDDQKKTIDESRDTIAARDVKIGELQDTVGILDDQLKEYEAEEFDIADGRVTDISSRTNIVWINVGFEDNLPQNATFAIYPQDSTQFRKEGIKGMIEVKRILGAHTAEARVTYEKVSDPILPGDMINTTTWSPGRRQSFAIAGFIDIDGDGRSDATRLRNIITRNGGDVVAYINEEGDMVGELDATTRFLIVGDDFRVGQIDEGTISKMVKATTELNNRASQEAVEKKYYQEMLEEMGYRGESSTSPVGGGDSGFAPRRPPVRGTNGAY